MTTSTIGYQGDEGSYDATRLLAGNYTIAFWARARQPLENAYYLSEDLIDVSAASDLLSSVALDGANGLGFWLGTDGFAVVSYRYLTSLTVITDYSGSLNGWHHYAIVVQNNVAFVYVDGGATSTGVSSMSDPTYPLVFAPEFGNIRWVWALLGSLYGGDGFEGWLSELRMANRSLLGGEALTQMNNRFAWDFSYSMAGCSGEDHRGTNIDVFGIQQAFLVCRPAALPTCGVNSSAFIIGEAAGCLCAQANASSVCIDGVWAANQTVMAAPLAQWNFGTGDNGSVVTDATGRGFDATLVRIVGGKTAYGSENGSTFVAFAFGDYALVDSLSNFQFGTRNFYVEARIRTTSLAGAIVSKRQAVDKPFFTMYVNQGLFRVSIGYSSYGNGTGVMSSDAVNQSVADGQWHSVSFSRKGSSWTVTVDEESRTVTAAVYNINNTGPILIGNQHYPDVLQLNDAFNGDIANVSIYVDALPGAVCSMDTGYVSESAAYPQVLGFCSPTKDVTRPCCAVAGCASCDQYTACSSLAPTSPSTKTTTSVTTTVMSNTSSSLATTMTSQPANASSNMTTTLVTAMQTSMSTAAASLASTSSSSLIGPIVGGVIGGVVFVVCILVLAYCVVKRRQSSVVTAAPSSPQASRGGEYGLVSVVAPTSTQYSPGAVLANDGVSTDYADGSALKDASPSNYGLAPVVNEYSSVE